MENANIFWESCAEHSKRIVYRVYARTPAWLHLSRDVSNPS